MTTNIERFNVWANQLLAIQDAQKQREFLEIINRRTEEGCVVKALESAFGVEATDEEWDMRIADIARLRKEFEPLKAIENDPQYKDEISTMKRVADRRMIKNFISRVALGDTPLGIALREHSLTDTVLSSPEVLQTLEEGKIVLIDIVRGKARHLAHIGVIDNGVVSLSDDGEEVKLTEEKYAVFIFSPKPTTS